MEVLLIKLMVIIRLSMGINDTKQDIGSVSNANVNQINGNGTTIINNNGISVVDAYNICHAVVENDLKVYALKAEEKAQERLKEISSSLIDRITKVEKGLFEKFEEPAIQLALRKPVLEYIKSGDKDEAELMIDNLIQRLEVEEHTTLQSLIDEASSIIPKLSVDCLNFLSLLVFSKAYFGFTRLGFFNFCLPKIEKWFESSSRITELDVAYLRQIGCCSGGMTISYNQDLEDSFLMNYNWIFRDGVTMNELYQIFDIDTLKKTNVQLFTKEGDKAYLMFPNENIAHQYLKQKGLEDMFYQLNAHIDKFILHSKGYIFDKMKDKIKYWEKVSSLFQKQSVKSLFVNPVGYYIAMRKMKLDLDLNLDFKDVYGED